MSSNPMRMIRIAAAGWLLLVEIAVTAPSSADDGDGNYPPAKIQKEICSQGTQRQMNGCIISEYLKLDREMIAYYSELVRVLNHPAGVQAAQQAWERYRDAECSDRVMQIGIQTTLYPYADSACRIELTEERIRAPAMAPGARLQRMPRAEQLMQVSVGSDRSAQSPRKISVLIIGQRRNRC